ncbi:MBL fold metallo-hydrolase [Subtercola sp. RTI3]|uniref:MBL fold metallo-hydrolase n=1 Tax=Subtercola sp. RTI3 TaxID=3048639 RepID=UPI002B235259|nr:MBL fold metallo-hydrolase [Subtercola sp. RTI3]MEA9985606.1 MBL fold metallo-hydrolase [Subtercola sp. RTI3]
MTSRAQTTPETVRITVLGGPTVLIEYGGLRFLTDPTFDPPQSYPGDFTKTTASTRAPDALGHIDAVLLSHDEHIDNLDLAGLAFLPRVPVTLTTPSAAERLGTPSSPLGADTPTSSSVTAQGLSPWQSVELPRPAGGTVTVTAAPALHGPPGADLVVGEVTGFLLAGDALPTVYISGDNASLDLVREIAHRAGPIDTAVLFAGAVRRPVLDGALLTLDAADAAEAAQILDARRIVLAHVDGWAHFTEGTAATIAAFTAAGLTDRLQL